MDAEARAAGTSSWPSRKSAATWTARGGPAMQACSPSPRKELVEQKHRALCLLVDRQNPARRLYERKGFRDVGFSVSTDTSVIVVADL